MDRPEAPQRTLMGPGPLDLHPRVYRALLTPGIGHLDPAYMKTLDAIRERLRHQPPLSQLHSTQE